MSKCYRPQTWDDYERAQEHQQMSIEPDQFFACNPYGNAAQNDHLREAGTVASPAGDDWQTGWSLLKDQAMQAADESSQDDSSSCSKDAATSYKQALQADSNNTSSGEVAELIAACGVGAMYGTEGGPLGLLLGCVGGAVLNELQELMTDTTKVGIDLYQCQ